MRKYARISDWSKKQKKQKRKDEGEEVKKQRHSSAIRRTLEEAINGGDDGPVQSDGNSTLCTCFMRATTTMTATVAAVQADRVDRHKIETKRINVNFAEAGGRTS